MLCAAAAGGESEAIAGNTKHKNNEDDQPQQSTASETKEGAPTLGDNERRRRTGVETEKGHTGGLAGAVIISLQNRDFATFATSPLFVEVEKTWKDPTLGDAWVRGISGTANGRDPHPAACPGSISSSVSFTWPCLPSVCPSRP